MISLRLTVNQVIAMTTSQAAREIGRPEFGKQALECEMTLLAGKVVFDRGARAGQDF